MNISLSISSGSLTSWLNIENEHSIDLRSFRLTRQNFGLLHRSQRSDCPYTAGRYTLNLTLSPRKDIVIIRTAKLSEE